MKLWSTHSIQIDNFFTLFFPLSTLFTTGFGIFFSSLLFFFTSFFQIEK